MFADRNSQGHRVLSSHEPYTVEHVSFNYVQLADNSVGLVRISLGEEKRRAGG
jgi:hypothetical protein